MKKGFLFFWLLTIAGISNAQTILNIRDEKPQDSKEQKQNEQTDSTELPNDPLVFNVVHPKLTFYPADPSIANGTSVIICPGGGFYYLHISTEGTEVARWLNKKGVYAFVLEYRLIHSETNLPVKERSEMRKDTAAVMKQMTTVIPMAIDDAKQAIAYVREHATELKVSPDKIGIIGFSAGGTLAVASAFDCTTESRPDFIAPIYPYVPPTLSINIVIDTPPVFIAAATDDGYHLVSASINLYNKWLAAGHSAELHIYSKGGHGFGMNKQNQPSDTWIERFGDWLHLQGFIK